MGVKILTDSCCDLPMEIYKEYDIDVLPIVVLKDDKEYLDRVSIQPIEVYDGMRNGDIFKTAQITPISFKEKFEEYASNNISVIYIAFSSALSGTYQTSLFVRDTIKEKYPNFDIEIVDTKAASLGFGLMVLHAAKLARDGKSKNDILTELKFFRDKLESIFTVDDLEYLFRGGRVSKTASIVGGLLSIKPILEVSDEGELIPIEKIRGRNKVFKRMVEMMTERAKDADLANQTVAISHGDDLESVYKLKELIEQEFGTKSFLISDIGAAVGSHAGPGTIALFFLSK